MEDFSKSAFETEAFVDAEQGAKGRHNEFCLNCGTKLTDVYCPHCGQKDIPRRQTMGELGTNFISSFFNYEGKFLKTNRDLILKPGFLAMEYNAGRRESYFHPVRMYFFVSFVFFLLFFYLPGEEKTKKVVSDDKELTESDLKELGVTSGNQDSVMEALSKNPAINKYVPGLTDSLRKYAKVDSASVSRKRKKSRSTWSLTKSQFKTVEQYDSAQRAKPESERDGWFGRRMQIRVIELNNRYSGNMEGFGTDFVNAFKENFSKILFFLLPVFALLLKLLYIRRDYFFSEHLVFSIYFYNFFYFAASVQMLWALIPYVGSASGFIGLGIYVYLLFAMKRMYQQGWGKTIAKFFLFSFMFFWVSVIALSIAAFAILMAI